MNNKYACDGYYNESDAGKAFTDLWLARTEHSPATLMVLVSQALRAAYKAGEEAERERVGKKMAEMLGVR